MNFQNILLLIVKVIVLLSVILIFSYVNTKDAHIAKMKKNAKIKKIKKEGFKEGADNSSLDNIPINEMNVNKVITNMVDKTRSLLEGRLNEEGADKDAILTSLNTVNENNKVEGFTEKIGIDDEKKECKYEGKSILGWLWWFFTGLLYVLIWILTALFNLLPEKTKNKPKKFFNSLISPISWVFYVMKKLCLMFLWGLDKLKYVFIFIIATMGNIAFVFAPQFIIDIISYFLAPFVVLSRRIGKVFSYSPFGAICWSK